MEKMIKFFIDNARMNYVLFFLVCLIGVISYSKTPKEIFPTFELGRITVSGSYSGASIDILDKIAVREIEDELRSIQGLDEMTTAISPGTFSITLELLKGTNKYDTAAKIKDAIDKVKQNFPEDMDEPKVTVAVTGKSLVDISITSDTKNLSGLIDFAKRTKTTILSVKDIAEVKIYGDSDMFYNIQLDEKKMESFGLNKNSVYNVISGLSYIFPAGKIEGDKKHFYLSTYNGKKDSDSMEKTLIKVDGKKIYLKDIAIIEKKYEDASTLSSIDAKQSLTLSVSQTEDGNAIVARNGIVQLVEKLQKQNPEVLFTVHNDNSQRIIDRLNVVGSNILLGLILVTLLLVLLINTRMALIVALGIPTSFIMAATYFYLVGYTINMISLVGVLVALGIVVDDAIVVSENIQQKIEEGHAPHDAAILGAKEMAKPVILASLTTLFTFIPLLMLSGTLGEFMKLIPIAVSALLVASLIESFVFLPLHAAHILNKEAKALSWDRANAIYYKIIHLHIHYKKTFLFLFLVLIPILTFFGIKQSKFQMFSRFDSTTINMAIKANINTSIDQSYMIVNTVAKDLLEVKDKFAIETISTVAGYRRNAEGSSENYPYVSYITLELYKLEPQSFLDKYITPYLSFYSDDSPAIRKETSFVLSKKLSKFLEKHNYKEQFNLEEIYVVERKAGPVKSDIKIGVISPDNKKIRESVQKIEDALSKMDGMRSISNSAKLGVEEIKFKLNAYGEQLGLDEQKLGAYLSNMFLSKKKTSAFDDRDLLEIKIESVNKNDLDTLQNMKITLDDGREVLFKEISDYEIIKSFEKVEKDFGEKTFYVYANVDSKIITSGEVIAKLKSTLNDIKENDVSIKILGEEKRKNDLKNDMISATTIALLLVALSMLYMFNSFRDTFIIMSVIPFSFLGVLVGHIIMDLNLTMPSIVGSLGLAGVVVNDGIIMLTKLRTVHNVHDLVVQATKRLRPIFLTTMTTLLGLFTLMFFPSGEAAIFQTLAIALGFGLAWGTVLNLVYVPTFFAVLHRNRFEKLAQSNNQ
jgi:multidrug efflux pump subunit AcrB